MKEMVGLEIDRYLGCGEWMFSCIKNDDLKMKLAIVDVLV